MHVEVFYSTFFNTHLEKARYKNTIKARPTNPSTPLQIGFASNHSTNETAKDPNIVRITRLPKV